jgi:pimeloyl-ACP methyl ester carboxylesterase
MPSLSLPGTTIGFDDAGAGEDALLLVHGHPFDRSMWRPQAAALRDSMWRVVVPDLRGYGASGVTPGTVTLDVFADDLAALLDHLALPRVVIGGLSMGGQIVMEFCRRHPTRVRGILLAATTPVAESMEGKRARNEMADRLLREGMGPYADEVLSKMLAPATIARHPEVAAHVRAMMQRTDPAGAAAALRGRAERPDYTTTLASMTVPALVCVGSADAFTTRADAELMARALPHARLLWMDGVGHMPNLERPAAFSRSLRELLAAVGPA